MSFDIDLQVVGEAPENEFSRAIVDDVFRLSMTKVASGIYDLSFDDGHGILYIDETPMINGFGINRPSGVGLYNCYYEVLRRVPGAYIVWPGGSVVADSSVIPDLPPPLTAAFGQPSVVHSGQDIVDAIKRGP